MKKTKIGIVVAICLIAFNVSFSINTLKQNSSGKINLSGLIMTATADPEITPGWIERDYDCWTWFNGDMVLGHYSDCLLDWEFLSNCWTHPCTISTI